jgi:D-alanyl-D-alanine dipeptidase
LRPDGPDPGSTETPTPRTSGALGRVSRPALLLAVLLWAGIVLLPGAASAGTDPTWITLLGRFESASSDLILRESEGRLELLARPGTVPDRAARGGLTFDGRRYLRVRPIAAGRDRFDLPGTGGALVARRDPSGEVRAVLLSGRAYERRTPPPGREEVFRIVPLRSPEELRPEALAATPPRETGKRPSDLVELKGLIPNLVLDIRYATPRNFMGTPLYPCARAFLQRPAAEALARAQARLAERGLGLVIYDAYRPWYVTKMFWDATPDAQKDFVANPAQGSRHNRGCAVDLGIVDLRSGRPIPMPSGYDEFSPRAFPDWPGGTTRERANRELLRRTLEAEGFRVFHTEWWHFDYRGWKDWPIGNEDFDRIGGK